VSLRPEVRDALRAHGIEPGPADTAEALRARLNDLYLEEVRRLRSRQRAGEIALADYSAHAAALKERFPLLGLPLALWVAPG
jgi:hypothetical protein